MKFMKKNIYSKRSFLKLISISSLIVLFKLPFSRFTKKNKVHWILKSNDY